MEYDDAPFPHAPQPAIARWQAGAAKRLARLARGRRQRLTRLAREPVWARPAARAWLALCCVVALALPHGAMAGPQPVFGAGPSTQIVTLFFEHFERLPQAKGMDFAVPPRSTKHRGGIRASGHYLFGRTGRPLTAEEKAEGKLEIFLAKIPVGFATSPAIRLPPLEPEGIERIFSGRVSNWASVGGPDAPIMRVGREPTEAVLMALSEWFPSLRDADYDIVLRRDHAVVNLLASPAGANAIGYGALSNFADLNVIRLEGLSPGVRVGLVVDEANRRHPMVQAVREFANSDQWRETAARAGYFPIEQEMGDSR